MIQTLEKFSKIKIKLSVPLISVYIAKGYRQVDIAKDCNISEQAVSNFIKKHRDEIIPLIDTTDGIAAFRAKHIANKVEDKIEDILAVEEFNKKDIGSLTIAYGVHTDKYRLLSDKSTQNVSIDAVVGDRKELAKRKAELLERLARNKGNGEEVKESSPKGENKS